MISIPARSKKGGPREAEVVTTRAVIPQNPAARQGNGTAQESGTVGAVVA
jgi:hypothetical protein